MKIFRKIGDDVSWNAEIGYVLHNEGDRKDALDNDFNDKGICSELIPEVTKTAKRKNMLCFIGFSEGQLSHIARAEVRYPARSGNDRIDLWKIEELPTPVAVDRLVEAVGNSYRTKQATIGLASGGYLPPKTFQAVMEALRKISPEAFGIADSLRKRDEEVHPTISDDIKTNWVLQRDAVITALDLANISRSSLHITTQPDVDITGDSCSIFDRIGDVRGLEDIIIMHDMEKYPEWKEIKSHQYPAKTFSSEKVTLTVILANKLPLEQQLGVDLIYVNESLKSVVLVQYKIMSGDDGENGYRPNEQLVEEIRRMDSILNHIIESYKDIDSDGYRLSYDAFFLKLCKSVIDHEEEGLVPGFYLPLSYWKLLMNDPALKGQGEALS